MHSLAVSFNFISGIVQQQQTANRGSQGGPDDHVRFANEQTTAAWNGQWQHSAVGMILLKTT